MSERDTLDTIWEVPDDLWQQIAPIIEELDPPKATGRKRKNARRMLDAIIFRMRSGCQWNKLPGYLGDDSTTPAPTTADTSRSTRADNRASSACIPSLTRSNPLFVIN